MISPESDRRRALLRVVEYREPYRRRSGWRGYGVATAILALCVALWALVVFVVYLILGAV